MELWARKAVNISPLKNSRFERQIRMSENLADRVETRVENRVAGLRWCLIGGRILHDSHRWIRPLTAASFARADRRLRRS